MCAFVKRINRRHTPIFHRGYVNTLATGDIPNFPTTKRLKPYPQLINQFDGMGIGPIGSQW